MPRAGMLSNGATAVFGPGTVIPEAATTLLHELASRLGHPLG